MTQGKQTERRSTPARQAQRMRSGSSSGATAKRPSGTKPSHSSSTPSRQAPAPAARSSRTGLPVSLIALIAVLVVVAVLALRVLSSAMTIDVMVNGTPYTIHGAKTLQTAIKESGLPVNPGDLISIRGVVLKKSEGEPFTATVNGDPVTDPDLPLHNGDDLQVSDGKDKVEDYTVEEQTIPHEATIWGAGAIHKFEAGSDGVLQIRTGSVSGDVIELKTAEPEDASCMKYNPEVGEDKVIALTFDEGPSEKYTADILDILQENDARATFFCVGTEIEKYNDDLVRRERDEGHQVCTGTYDHARSGDGMSVASIDESDLVRQVEHGREVIAEALGDEAASRVVRLPGGELSENMVRILDEYVEVEVGWNVDTGDWMELDENGIYRVLMQLEPGDIVLCHDGGGDHSGTVAALRRAVPELRAKGYSFVTIDDLLEYPAQ